MIQIDRSSVQNPFERDPELAERARREIAAYAARLESGKGGPPRAAFRAYLDDAVREALAALTHAKCAYCESAIGASLSGDVEHFRPPSSVVERPEHPGYWWLANAWENLLLSCVDCNRPQRRTGPAQVGWSGKGNRFPLADEAGRALQPGEEAREQPLLLDPTRDPPEAHLVFSENGMVASDTERGNATISVLGLNRRELVDRRARAARAVRGEIDEYRVWLDLLQGDLENEGARARLAQQVRALGALAEPGQEFAALKRQMVQPVLERLARVLGQATPASLRARAVPRVTPQRQREAARATQAYQAAMADYSLDEAAGVRTYRLQRRLIQRVTLHNVRAIRDLDLDLTPKASGRNPWHMLLGENGSGKSSVLQAVALTLVGADYFCKLVAQRGVHPADYVRYRCRSGWVKVKLSGFPAPHGLTFTRDGVAFQSPTGETTTVRVGAEGETTVEGQGWRPQTVLLGYGATRLLPRRAPQERLGGDFARVDNLFDPFVPLFDAGSWLMALDDRAFEGAALVLKDLLALDEDAALVRAAGRVLVQAHGTRTPLKQLSDGYQTVVASAIDILEVALRLWPNLENAEGIVLLDEIGAHLHPTWKMQIVQSLRRALPGLQFLATTHQPLCLRGLGAGEVIVMQRDEQGEIEALTDLPSPGDFRVDQLLTSAFFGLNSTVDPDVERLFDEYYALLALPQRDAAQEERLASLRAELKDRRHLGSTLREGLMYEAIDRLIAEQKVGQRRPLPELKQAAVDQVSSIWQAATEQAAAGQAAAGQASADQAAADAGGGEGP